MLLVSGQYILLSPLYNAVIGGYILVSTIITVFFIYAKSNVNTTIAHVLASWSYTYALFNLFILRRNEEWQPTGGVKASKSSGYKTMVSCLYIYTISLFILTIFATALMPYNIFLIYLYVNLFVHFVGCSYLLTEGSESTSANNIIPKTAKEKVFDFNLK